VFSADGSTLRGVLFEGVPDGGPLSLNPAPIAAAVFTGDFAPVNVQAGDILVFEYGSKYANATQYNANIEWKSRRDSSTADLPATNGFTGAGNGWLEITIDEPPLPPTNLVSVGTTATTIDLTWDAPATGMAPTSYEIRVNGGTNVDIGLVTEYSVTGLTPETSYSFEVRSVAASGESTWAGPFEIETDPPADNRLVWNAPENRFFEVGLDRGVLYPRQGPAVPWLGLTSVDEEGGDGAASYYIDGRPFLFLPRPKEYKATLKAFTYPDVFAQIMGVSEIADGMYLDSQPGDAFDLSYRTLVGSATEGSDHGYKIHLVYNATVTPQALTYESLSNSINPTTFSWEIQAVPVKVEGFRPTAHIIIDTRHMDQAKIDAIEKLLYGGVDAFAQMPSPQVIFDLLSYGDTIIITDNGDGTFDVTGSYENVYMISDGVFQVDNVDATNNGDGTFTVSSTNV
jgi:hypothetical protein